MATSTAESNEFEDCAAGGATEALGRTEPKDVMHLGPYRILTIVAGGATKAVESDESDDYRAAGAM